jgi:hypothetical protein
VLRRLIVDDSPRFGEQARNVLEPKAVSAVGVAGQLLGARAVLQHGVAVVAVY